MSRIELKLDKPIYTVNFDIDAHDVKFIDLEKAEAFKIVLEELKECSLFCGEYDAKNGNEHFMYGIQTVMESIAARADDTDAILNNFTDEFLHNMIVSEKKAEHLKLKQNAKEKKKNAIVDVDELNRCEKCKKWTENFGGGGYGYCYLDGSPRTTDASDYCSWWEKKGDRG